MADVKVMEWYPIPNIWLSADFSQRKIVIKQKDWEISISLPEKDEVEFVKSVMSIVEKVGKITKDFDIDEVSVEDLERKRDDIASIVSMM